MNTSKNSFYINVIYKLYYKYNLEINNFVPLKNYYFSFKLNYN